VASTEFLIVSPLAPATREFLYYQFQSDDFAGRFRSCSSGTSTSHQRVKPTDFVKLKALLPPSSLIEAFTNHVGPMCRLIHNRRIHNHNLRTTRDLLLPKLISGQLDVEELDVDAGEPLVEATT
jgi:type I restriction enzyme S subunit